MAGPNGVDTSRERGLQDYRKKLLEHKEVESRLKESKHLCRIDRREVMFFCDHHQKCHIIV